MQPTLDLFSDFDDVLFPTRKMSLEFFRQHYGVTIPDETYFCGHSLEELIMNQIPHHERPTKDEFYMHFSVELLASFKWHEGLEPMHGASDVIPELAKKFNLRVATARMECARPVVRHLLDTFFPGIFLDVHHVWRPRTDGGFDGVPKKDFVARYKNSRGFVDDNPREVRDMLGITESYLFDPFGFHINEEGIPNRVTSWHELGNLLL